MTFWQFLTNIGLWLEAHFTRGLGVAGGTLTILVANDAIPPKWVKFCIGLIAVLTYWRGQTITKRVDNANAIIAQNTRGSIPVAQEKVG